MFPIILLCLFAQIREIPPPTPEIIALVQQLGDNRYGVREDAAAALLKLDLRAVRALEAATESNEDIEIKYRSRRILEEIWYGVTPSKGRAIPTIWALPNEVRFPNGVDAEPDLALKYYRDAFTTNHPGAAFHYELPNVASWATQNLIADYRQKGLLLEEAVAFLDKMIYNLQHYYHVDYQPSWEFDADWNGFSAYEIPPSPLLTKKFEWSENREVTYNDVKDILAP